jgi:hypothetical protein
MSLLCDWVRPSVRLQIHTGEARKRWRGSWKSLPPASLMKRFGRTAGISDSLRSWVLPVTPDRTVGNARHVSTDLAVRDASFTYHWTEVQLWQVKCSVLSGDRQPGLRRLNQHSSVCYLEVTACCGDGDEHLCFVTAEYS